MTTATEWSHMESSMDDIAPSSDLFDGDILGDELMDIYNAAVVGGGDDDAMNGKAARSASATVPEAHVV
jgi:hypothetical protein